MHNGQEGSSARRWSSRKLSRLAWLLPTGALALLLLLLFAVHRDSRAPASDLDTGLVLVTLALVPVSALAGIVLAVLAFVRARQEGPKPVRGAKRKLLVPIVVASGAVAITVGLVWAIL